MTRLWSGTFIVKQYLQYWLNAIDQYSLQTPFTYNFYNDVILEGTDRAAFDEIEAIRSVLLKNHAQIEVLDLGAGSVVEPGNLRTISKIARFSLSSPKFSRFLFRLIRHFQPTNIVELGTSLGINTAYMAKASPGTTMYTLEGCSNIASLASAHFEQLHLESIKLIAGDINETLPVLLKQIGTVEFVFFDANHTEAATLRYFDLCLQYKKGNSVFIFDDIHLSKGMHRAWEKIKTHPEVSLSMDIFDAGIVFFEKGLQPGHYTLTF